MAVRRVGTFFIGMHIFRFIRISMLQKNCTQMWSMERVYFVVQVLTVRIEFIWQRIPTILRRVAMTSAWPHTSRTVR